MIEQATLFDPAPDERRPRRLDLERGEVWHWPAFFAAPERDDLFADVLATTAWEQEELAMYGRKVAVPRLTGWYGDAGCVYTYSHLTLQPQPWTPALATIRDQLELATGATFNSVLANLYRDGNDSVSWHSDDEPELGPDPVIASVSFGATRTFQLRGRWDRTVRHDIELGHGSLLVMRGSTQRDWHHQLPKTARPVAERVNLTFRTVAGSRGVHATTAGGDTHDPPRAAPTADRTDPSG